MKVQARITLPPDLRRALDELRMAWNPEKATGNPAHVTLVYHDEAPDPDLLADRLQSAASQLPPFELIIGTAEKFPGSAAGAFLKVTDPTGGVSRLRESVLVPPFNRRGRYGLHVTLLHPDQGERLEEAWPSCKQLSPVGSFRVKQVQLVGPGNSLLAEFPLAADEPDGRG
jgi:2'-5' RNA ligase